MSSAEVAARTIKEIQMEDFKVLRSFVKLLRNHERVTISQLAAHSEMHRDKVKYSVNKLNRFDLVVENGPGYSLIITGLDALALKILADRDVIVGLGGVIGVGKESHVYEAYGPNHEKCAVKLFRIGRTSFRDVKRKRSYQSEFHHWLQINIEAAKKENVALKKLHTAGIKVPEPRAISQHTIVMQIVYGQRLINCTDLDNPRHIFERILDNVKLALDAGLVSADLSEYNVLYDGDDVWIIDWPQNVSRSHPNADALLKRDLSNITKFFKKKYGLKYDLRKALDYVSA